MWCSDAGGLIPDQRFSTRSVAGDQSSNAGRAGKVAAHEQSNAVLPSMCVVFLRPKRVRTCFAVSNLQPNRGRLRKAVSILRPHPVWGFSAVSNLQPQRGRTLKAVSNLQPNPFRPEKVVSNLQRNPGRGLFAMVFFSQNPGQGLQQKQFAAWDGCSREQENHRRNAANFRTNLGSMILFCRPPS